MQYLNDSDNYKDLTVEYANRAGKALSDRQQTRLFEKRATFDNFGLARPKNTLPLFSLLNLGNGECLAKNEKTGEWFRSLDHGLTWTPERFG